MNSHYYHYFHCCLAPCRNLAILFLLINFHLTILPIPTALAQSAMKKEESRAQFFHSVRSRINRLKYRFTGNRESQKGDQIKKNSKHFEIDDFSIFRSTAREAASLTRVLNSKGIPSSTSVRRSSPRDRVSLPSRRTSSPVGETKGVASPSFSLRERVRQRIENRRKKRKSFRIRKQ